MKQYWHELTPDERQAFFDAITTVDKIRAKFMQPDWCLYPNALDGMWGCWSLISRESVTKEYCSTCELCKK